MNLSQLTSTESILKFNPERLIHIEQDDKYKLSLVGFYSDNNISNLNKDGVLYFSTKGVKVYGVLLDFTKGAELWKRFKERINKYSHPGET